MIPLEVLEKKFREEGEDVEEEVKPAELDQKKDDKPSDEDDEEDDWETSTKITRMMQLLEETRKMAPTEKTIIFCSFTKMLDMVEKPLREANFKFVRVRSPESSLMW